MNIRTFAIVCVIVGVTIIVGRVVFNQQSEPGSTSVSSQFPRGFVVPQRLTLFTGYRGGYGATLSQHCVVEYTLDDGVSRATAETIYGAEFAYYTVQATTSDANITVESYLDADKILYTLATTSAGAFSYRTSLVGTSTEAGWYTRDGRVRDSLPEGHLATIAQRTDNFQRIKRPTPDTRTCARLATSTAMRVTERAAVLASTTSATSQYNNELQGAVCHVCSTFPDDLTNAQCQVLLGCKI